jgi:hypothetical protein
MATRKSRGSQAAQGVARALDEKRARAVELALAEIKDLKGDLATLEKILQGKRKPGDFALYDVVHSAFEIFRNAQTFLDASDLLGSVEQEASRAEALGYLDRNKATLLKKPSGWHWISQKGEMHFLARENQPEKAAEKLRSIRTLVTKVKQEPGPPSRTGAGKKPKTAKSGARAGKKTAGAGTDTTGSAGQSSSEKENS